MLSLQFSKVSVFPIFLLCHFLIKYFLTNPDMLNVLCFYSNYSGSLLENTSARRAFAEINLARVEHNYSCSLFLICLRKRIKRLGFSRS
jgi:hypothetical protein